MDNKLSRTTNGKTIICIVGRSGAGKTTLAENLQHHIPVVVSKTTRAARNGEISGVVPYHSFTTTTEYIRDVVTNGKVAIGDIARGDDVMVADTTIDGNTYWTVASDILKYPEAIVAYVIDPTGVANLKKSIEKAKDLIVTHKYTEMDCPNLYMLAYSEIAVLYVDAVDKIMDSIPEARKNRDSQQELGWGICSALATFYHTTPFVEDLRERNIYGKIAAYRLAEHIKTFYGIQEKVQNGK